VLPAIRDAARMRRAHPEKNEDGQAAGTSARGGAREINGVELFAETFERRVSDFIGSFKSGLSDLVARDSRIGYSAPVILGPESPAQPNRVAHTLLPSMPVERCTLRAIPS